jgi:hypothetical protein
VPRLLASHTNVQLNVSKPSFPALHFTTHKELDTCHNFPPTTHCPPASSGRQGTSSLVIHRNGSTRATCKHFTRHKFTDLIQHTCNTGFYSSVTKYVLCCVCSPSSTSTSPRLHLRRPTGANFLSRHQLANLSPEPHTLASAGNTPL